MKWASDDAWSYLNDEIDFVHEPETKRRMSALYVECDRPTIESPNDTISAEMAKSLIHIVAVAVHRIVEVTEYMGDQIGTKGFMK